MTTNIVNVFEPAQFGVGDGATTEFQIGGPREVVTSITPTGVWRQDWQGNQRLYPTPRTNLQAYSVEVGATGWGRTRTAVRANYRVGPDGLNSLSEIEQTTAGGPGYTAPSSAFRPSVQPGTLYELSAYFARGTAAASTVSIANGGLMTQATVRINWETEPPTLFGLSGGVDASLVPAPNATYKLTLVINSGTESALCLVFYPDNSQTLGALGYIGFAQVELFPGGGYIPTSSAPVTLTDYSASSTGLITMGQVPAIGASLTWTGSYTYEYREDDITLADRTVISQYATSPTLRQLIRNMDEYINPDADFDAFYDFVWNVETAQGFGLDIWGRIVGVGRMLTIPGNETFLGYNEALNWQPFNQAPMYTGVQTSQTYRLADDAYRKLILVKALANISDCTSPSLNRLLTNLFAGRGRCYVSDTGKMEFRYVFEFALEPYEIAILTQSGAIPKPAGVLSSLLQVDVPTTFGFNEAVMQPFGSGVFFTSSGLINASQ